MTLLLLRRLLRSTNRRRPKSRHRWWALRWLRGLLVRIPPTKLEERLLLLLSGRGGRHRGWLRALEQLRKGALFLGRRHGRPRRTHAVGRLLVRRAGSGSPGRLLRYSRHLRNLRHLRQGSVDLVVSLAQRARCQLLVKLLPGLLLYRLLHRWRWPHLLIGMLWSGRRTCLRARRKPRLSNLLSSLHHRRRSHRRSRLVLSRRLLPRLRRTILLQTMLLSHRMSLWWWLSHRRSLSVSRLRRFLLLLMLSHLRPLVIGRGLQWRVPLYRVPRG